MLCKTAETSFKERLRAGHVKLVETAALPKPVSVFMRLSQLAWFLLMVQVLWQIHRWCFMEPSATFRSDERSARSSAASPPTPAAGGSAETNPAGPPAETRTDNQVNSYRRPVCCFVSENTVGAPASSVTVSTSDQIKDAVSNLCQKCRNKKQHLKAEEVCKSLNPILMSCCHERWVIM